MDGSQGSSDTVYLDYNATTPLEPSVIEAIHNALVHDWGNPSSSHGADVIFTSGGTESNNLVLNTALQHFWKTFSMASINHCESALPHIITSNLEHDSIRLVLEAFHEQHKAEVTFVPASKTSGRIEVDDIIAALKPTTCMVTVMLANNETGVIQPVAEIAERIRFMKRDGKHECKILIHTDAAQALGKIPVIIEDLSVDYLTIVGHKFYGPRIGAIYVKGLGRENQLFPMFYGGGQEHSYRPGTENTAMIAGLGEAARLVTSNLSIYQLNMAHVRDYLEQHLQGSFQDTVVINCRFTTSERLPNTSNVSLLGENLQGSKVLSHLRRTQASVGAACHSGTEPRASAILLASGVHPDVAINALRLSVGRHTTTADIDIFIEDLRNAVAELTSEN